MFSNFFFFLKSYRLWDDVGNYGVARGATKYVTTWRIRIACWISKTTCTHEHAHTRLGTRTHIQICNIYCFSTATMLCERSSILRYTYICLYCSLDKEFILYKPIHLHHKPIDKHFMDTLYVINHAESYIYWICCTKCKPQMQQHDKAVLTTNYPSFTAKHIWKHVFDTNYFGESTRI
jgi:hypothetical protein